MRIVKSAIVYQNECISGYNHEECFKELFNRYDRDVIKAQDIEQGFITDTNEFVSREEAMWEAVESGQIRKTYTDEEEVPPLMSEEMHICWLHEKDKEIEQLKAHIADMEQEQIKIMQEHNEFYKQVQKNYKEFYEQG